VGGEGFIKTSQKARTYPRSALGPRCAVCRHPQLNEITGTLAMGMSHRAVAKKYGFTQPVVSHHVKEHMGPALT
jgi:hypothetical protein